MTDFDMMVVDVTLGAEDAVAVLAEFLTEYLGLQDSGVILTIPGGELGKNDRCNLAPVCCPKTYCSPNKAG